MELNAAHALIDHLDHSLKGQHSPEMEQKIRDDHETAVEWHYLRLAVESVQEAGLYDQVETAKQEWLAQQSVAGRPQGAVIRTIYRKVMSVAAMVLLLAGGAAIFKYMTISSPGLYEKYYSAYALNTTRGAGTTSAIEQAYNNKNWEAVLSLGNSASAKDINNKTYFLTGIAELELKKYDQAIDIFQQVIAVNAQSGSDYFEEEAEFYLAMSWIARNDVNEAMPLLEKIKADKNHLFHETVAKMSFLDLRIAAYKDHK